eukprot:248228_1
MEINSCGVVSMLDVVIDFISTYSNKTESQLLNTKGNQLNANIFNGIAFFFNDNDEIIFSMIINFWTKSFNSNTTAIADGIHKLILEFTKQYYSHFSTTFISSLLTLSDDGTTITADDGQHGICRCKYSLPNGSISIWYVTMIAYKYYMMDGGNCFGVISNYDTTTKYNDESGTELFPLDCDENGADLSPNTFYGIGLMKDQNCIPDINDNNKNKNWIQSDYRYGKYDTVTFKISCDLRDNRNYVTVFEFGNDRHIGNQHLDYTFKLPISCDEKFYNWYPCCCAWGPIRMQIHF